MISRPKIVCETFVLGEPTQKKSRKSGQDQLRSYTAIRRVTIHYVLPLNYVQLLVCIVLYTIYTTGYPIRGIYGQNVCCRLHRRRADPIRAPFTRRTDFMHAT